MNRREFLKGTAAAGAAAVLMLPGPKKAEAVVPGQIGVLPGPIEEKLGKMIPTLTTFDQYGGFRRQGITLIAGGTGQGKTSYATYLCARAAKLNSINLVCFSSTGERSMYRQFDRHKRYARGTQITISPERRFGDAHRLELLHRFLKSSRPDLILDDLGPIYDFDIAREIWRLAFNNNIAYVKTVQTHRRSAKDDIVFSPAIYGSERMRWLANYGVHVRKFDDVPSFWEPRLTVKVFKNRYGPMGGYLVPISEVFG
jgi:hypothetical protein